MPPEELVDSGPIEISQPPPPSTLGGTEAVRGIGDDVADHGVTADTAKAPDEFV
jgi:hypothetical protein